MTDLRVIYLFYGLAFFAMGTVLLVRILPLRDDRLARVLGWLAAFGLLHWAKEWMDLIALMAPQAGSWPRVGLVVGMVSFAVLLVFALELLGLDAPPRSVRHQAVVALLLVAFLAVAAFAPDGRATAGALSRYLLAGPGAFLSAWVFITRRHRLFAGVPVSHWLLGAGLFFAVYGVASVVVPPAGFFPASHLHTGAFLETVGLPVELLRTIGAVGISVCIILSLNAFDEERKRLAARVAQMASFQQAILDSASIAVIATDPAGVVRLFSAGASRMLGYSASEVVGRATPTLFYEPVHLERRLEALSTELGRPVQAGLDALVAKALAGLMDQGEWTAIRKDGSRFPAWLAVTALRATKGQRPDLLIVGLDYTLEKALARAKSDFLSTVSHELRTPLTSIRGALGLLEGGVVGALAPEAMNLVQVGRTNADRLIRLINDLLDIDRIESGRLPLRTRAVAPEEAVGEALGGLQALAREAGVTLTSSIQTPARPLADKDRLVQVLVNLVSNALRFSPRGGAVHVQVTQESADRLRFSVVDHGPGIPAQQLPKLFKRFQQIETGEAPKGGSGLGLAISKAIVERHGGAIGVQSEEGQGSTFWFELPTAVVANLAAPALGAGATPLLLVEDDADFSQILRRLLAQDRYEVTCAATLAEARTRLESFKPAAILLDVRLPDGNGLELVRWLQDSERLRDVPVVVLTAMDVVPERQGLPVEIDWLEKPVDEERLRRMLQRAVRERRVPTVLVVGAEPAFRRALVERLSLLLQVRAVEATTGAEALRLARAQEFDLVVLDVSMPWPRDALMSDVLARDGHATPVLAYSSREPARVLNESVTHRLTTAQVADHQLLEQVRTLLNELRARAVAKPAGEGLDSSGRPS